MTGKPRRVILRNSTIDEVMDKKTYSDIKRLMSKGFDPIIENGFMGIKLGDYKIFGSSSLADILWQVIYEEKYNQLDYRGKKVLDIGGYFGETAILFYYWGASKVIIYEPLKENLRYILKNVEVNNLNAEIHDEGIGNNDNYTDIRYDKLDSSFGLLNKGSRFSRIKIRNIENILRENEIDIAKFDCEGAEVSLLNVNNNVLFSIPQYFIEYHSLEIKDSLIHKFISAGFKFRCVETRPIENVGLLLFEK